MPFVVILQPSVCPEYCSWNHAESFYLPRGVLKNKPTLGTLLLLKNRFFYILNYSFLHMLCGVHKIVVVITGAMAIKP